MTEHATSIPTSRVRRTAKVGSLFGAEVARTYRTKAANLIRSQEARDAADARRRLEAAGHIVDVLGEMKGPAMKLGQMASILDLTGLPPGESEGLQAKLGELRDRGPQTSFQEMRRVIEHDLGDRLSNCARDARAHQRGTRLRARGSGAASLRAPMARTPVHLRSRCGDQPVPSPSAGQRAAFFDAPGVSAQVAA